MTEAEWRACRNPSAMLDLLRHTSPKAPARRLRLYTCACCRRLPGSVLDGRLAEAVALVERFADREATPEELNRFRGALVREGYRAGSRNDYRRLCLCVVGPNARLWDAAGHVTNLVTELRLTAVHGPDFRTGAGDWVALFQSERVPLCDLIRDVFGPAPGWATPPVVSPWLTSTVTALARHIYQSLDFSPMPVLADALQDAGCDDEGVLGHCSGGGPHVRGCWVVDLLLGRK